MAHLAGMRLVTASEASENTRLNEQRLKVLAHGDTVNTRFLYESRFDFISQCRIWLSVNRKLCVVDDSDGFWRSVRMIPFNRRFTGKDADLRLGEKLRAESEGILAWMMKACLEWQAMGLSLPAPVSEATRLWQAETDPMADFLEACCLEGPDHRVAAGDLYRAYMDWAKTEGIPERERLSHTAFGRRLGERFRKDRTGPERCLCYVGIGLFFDQGGLHGPGSIQALTGFDTV